MRVPVAPPGLVESGRGSDEKGVSRCPLAIARLLVCRRRILLGQRKAPGAGSTDNRVGWQATWVLALAGSLPDHALDIAGEVCAETGRQVQACVRRPNQLRLTIETPREKRVAGTDHLLGTDACQFDQRDLPGGDDDDGGTDEAR